MNDEKLINNYKIGIFDPKGINNNPLTLNNNQYSDTYKELAKFWSNLPAYEMGKKIVKAIHENDVVLISSGTGSGKTVLVPKFAIHSLGYKGKIIITLPKKIITKKAAEYSALTLDVELGNQVGYQFRGENIKSRNTNLLYSTDGSIISQIKSDPLLRYIDIIIIDEAHERKVQIDLLIYLLKNTILVRKQQNMKPLKLIIMSATIDHKIFQKYFDDFKFKYLFLSGEPNYPISSTYLLETINPKTKEYLIKGTEIIKNIIHNINNPTTNKKDKKDKKTKNKRNKQNKQNKDDEYTEGDILFFVCTIKECEELTLELQNELNDSFVMALYSSFNPENEKYITYPEVYKELNSNYKRRIFISTNIAESSLTISNITYVIDSGLEISVLFDPVKNMNVMSKHPITKAQISQRKGRTGRTRSGFCFHLYTQKEEKALPDFPDPEIKKIDIKNTLLSLMKIGGDIARKNNKFINKNKEIINKEISDIGDNSEDNQNNQNIQNNQNDIPCFNLDNTIKMFNDFIQPPLKPYINDAVNYNKKYSLININNCLSIEGKLINESKLDVYDGLTLLYAWNINVDVFKNTFKIISICSLIKNGVQDLFYYTNESEQKSIKNNIKNFSNDIHDSEHVLLLKVFNDIETNQNNQDNNYNNYNLKLFNNVTKIYTRQIDKLIYLYNKHNIKLNDILIDNNDNINIIRSLNHGYKNNLASKNNSSNFKFNNAKCDISNSFFKNESLINKLKKHSAIIFHSNLFILGKLNLNICSPYLLT
jgi:pre-mRNA-splicing factor ATP-dependent RNA helicase DHX15/PRP43